MRGRLDIAEFPVCNVFGVKGQGVTLFVRNIPLKRARAVPLKKTKSRPAPENGGPEHADRDAAGSGPATDLVH